MGWVGEGLQQGVGGLEGGNLAQPMGSVTSGLQWGLELESRGEGILHYFFSLRQGVSSWAKRCFGSLDQHHLKNVARRLARRERLMRENVPAEQHPASGRSGWSGATAWSRFRPPPTTAKDANERQGLSQIREKKSCF